MKVMKDMKFGLELISFLRALRSKFVVKVSIHHPFAMLTEGHEVRQKTSGGFAGTGKYELLLFPVLSPFSKIWTYTSHKSHTSHKSYGVFNNSLGEYIL